ncbi:MAG: helix-turn-helix domain-containing protein [Clostridia bacterium]|nr:helix-turn-helix domain-containing protein [Clostridia bacterium]
MNSIGKRIKDAREQKKMSVEKLAKKMKTDPKLISDWESGALEPDTKSANRLASILSVTTDYILFGIDSAGGLHTMFPTNAKPEPASKSSILAFISAMLLFIGIGGLIMLFIVTATRMDIAGNTGFFGFFILTGTIYSALAFIGIALVGVIIGIISFILMKKEKKAKKNSKGNRK